MARQADPKIVEEVVRAIEKHPEGATLEQVEAALEVPRRTLQRRLAELVEAGQLRAIGQARQRRYQVIVAEARPEDLADGLLGVYELQRMELARDVLAWAYARSCQRYTAVRDALPEPDPLRLRNRDQLTEVVNAIVRDDSAIDESRIRELATPIVAAEDLEEFIAMAISELNGLHEGNLVRYRLRLSEFRRWRGHNPTRSSR